MNIQKTMERLAPKERQINITYTGEYPNLCRGEWLISVNGTPIENIPFQHKPADTFGLFIQVYLTEDYDEESEDYYSGLSFEEWTEKYHEWLAENFLEEEWEEVYEKVSVCDWRYSSCGGCI